MANKNETTELGGIRLLVFHDPSTTICRVSPSFLYVGTEKLTQDFQSRSVLDDCIFWTMRLTGLRGS